MNGVNKAILVGSVGEDPKTTLFPENNQVTTFSLATNSSYKDKEGNKQTKVEWHRIEVWNAKSKFAAEFIKKGTLVYVEGPICYDKSEKDGKTTYWTKIKADEITLFPKGTPATASSTPTANASTGSNPVAQAAQQATAYTNGNTTFSEPVNEDLPF